MMIVNEQLQGLKEWCITFEYTPQLKGVASTTVLSVVTNCNIVIVDNCSVD